MNGWSCSALPLSNSRAHCQTFADRPLCVEESAGCTPARFSSLLRFDALSRLIHNEHENLISQADRISLHLSTDTCSSSSREHRKDYVLCVFWSALMT